MKTAEIITIGDEILIGQIVDTNSAWMATELNLINIKVIQITSISDSPEHLIIALNDARQRAGLVLITGGLGPTKDDRTKKVLCEYFGAKMIMHKPTLEHIHQFFGRRGMGVNQLNHDQALVPDCCEVLPNPLGTAPGMWFEMDDTVFVSMPGVPFEMKEVMTNQVLPRLIGNNGEGAIYHKTVLTVGVPESVLAEKIEQWENALPPHIHLAYLPNPGQVRLRFSAYGVNENSLVEEVDCQIEKLKTIIPDAIYGFGNETLSEVLGRLLLSKNKTVVAAESCTGGYISHSFTSIPGSSKWFKGAVVAYSNELKTKLLGVKSDDIESHGAVSEQVVRQMAEGARNALGADYAIATSGIAGPEGGTVDKPVGTVWVAVASQDETIAQKFIFSNDRERNIIRASQSVVDILRLKMLKES